MNKASGDDGIRAELFQILKDKCCKSAAPNIWANLEISAVATGLEKVNIHFNAKEWATAQLHSFHMLAR